jgi:peptide chain release factor
MQYEITSARGPIECRLAVSLYITHICNTNSGIKVIKIQGNDEPVTIGKIFLKPYTSALVQTPENLKLTEGIILWTCPSVVRKNHLRKNWFFKVCKVLELAISNTEILAKDLKIDTFRSPGKGGQNVNKVETGVRITHLPTGNVGTSVTARTQLANRKLAMERLKETLHNINSKQQADYTQHVWQKHNEIERGNPVITFKGTEFQLVGGELFSDT